MHRLGGVPHEQGPQARLLLVQGREPAVLGRARDQQGGALLLVADATHRGGNDLLCGGTGNDTMAGGDGAERLFGEDGNDTVNGENGDDALSGGVGNDRLDGGAGTNTVDGGAGDDECRNPTTGPGCP